MAQSGFQSRTKYRIRKVILFTILLLPLWSFIVWWASPTTTLRVVMLDKTAQDFSNIEHRAFTWVLNHHHYVKEDGSNYSRRVDYLGHFPQPDNLLNAKDLDGYTQKQIDSIAKFVNVGYFIDTYGSTYEEWRAKLNNIKESGLVYGGLEAEDASLMDALQRQGKLLIAEFSIFGAPTPMPIRRRAEDILGVHFSGWVGRYWQDLEYREGGELPEWIPQVYQEQYHKEYEFDGPGIGFFHEDGRILILPENELIHNVPILETERHIAEEMGVDAFIRYPFWFEICTPDTAVRTVSQFRVYSSSAGLTQMRALGIPTSFPAVLVKPDWKTIYLAGDFTDNPVSLTTSRFAGITSIRSLFYDNQNPEDRKKFFWEWYEPFISKVLDSYLENSQAPELPPPPRSLYDITLELTIDERFAKVNWDMVPDPRYDVALDSMAVSKDSVSYQPTLIDPTHFVKLAAFPREYHADAFIEDEGIPFASEKFNVQTGEYEVVIPCRSDSVARFILGKCNGRYKQSEVLEAR